MGVYVPYLQICFDLLFSKCDILSLIKDNFDWERKKEKKKKTKTPTKWFATERTNGRFTATMLHDTKSRKTPARFFNFTSYIL